MVCERGVKVWCVSERECARERECASEGESVCERECE